MSSAGRAGAGDRDAALPRTPAPLRAPIPRDAPGSGRGPFWWEMRQRGLERLPSEKPPGEPPLSWISADGKISAGWWFSFPFSFLSFFPPWCFTEPGLFPAGGTSLVGEASSGNGERWLSSQLKPFCSHSSYCWKNHSLLELFSEKTQQQHPQCSAQLAQGFLTPLSRRGWRGARGRRKSEVPARGRPASGAAPGSSGRARTARAENPGSRLPSAGKPRSTQPPSWLPRVGDLPAPAAGSAAPGWAGLGQVGAIT